MTRVASDAPERGLSFAMDQISMNIHGDADTHIDALCHVIYDSELYNHRPAEAVTKRGAGELSISVAASGIAGRGVLLDIPRARAGLHPAALEYLADRKIGLLGSDGNNDTAPSMVQGVDFPVHVLAIVGLGLRDRTAKAADGDGFAGQPDRPSLTASHAAVTVASGQARPGRAIFTRKRGCPIPVRRRSGIGEQPRRSLAAADDAEPWE
jgi:hypothetical protein